MSETDPQADGGLQPDPPVDASADASADAQAVTQALRKVKDPELGINIVDLGLVYDVEVEEGKVRIKMTLTSPGCPAGPEILHDADRAVRMVDGVDDVDVQLVWEPFWTPDRIDPRVRSFFG